jgi:hypothetical protein
MYSIIAFVVISAAAGFCFFPRQQPPPRPLYLFDIGGGGGISVSPPHMFHKLREIYTQKIAHFFPNMEQNNTIKFINPGGYIETTIYSPPEKHRHRPGGGHLEKIRITEFFGDQNTQMMTFIFYPSRLIVAPIFVVDIVAFSPKAIICFTHFYNATEPKYFAELKRKWESQYSPANFPYLMQILSGLRSITAFPQYTKNIYMCFRKDSPTELNGALADLLEKYIFYLFNAMPGASSSPSREFNEIRARIERNFIYKKFMKPAEIDEYFKDL